MKAAVFSEHGGPEQIRVVDVAVPEPGPGEVRLRVAASALNHLDLWVRRGLPIETTMPHIGGSDVAGFIDALGDGVGGGAGGGAGGAAGGAVQAARQAVRQAVRSPGPRVPSAVTNPAVAASLAAAVLLPWNRARAS
jgi:NADPH:quinone reductase-like Zn-dependent oxidoreductase